MDSKETHEVEELLPSEVSILVPVGEVQQVFDPVGRQLLPQAPLVQQALERVYRDEVLSMHVILEQKKKTEPNYSIITTQQTNLKSMY